MKNQTLAEIVKGDHRAAAVFEKHHLDFCCKGKRTLQQACDELNIRADDLLHEISAINLVPGNSVSFDNMSLADLTAYIMKMHHSYVKSEMTPIAGYLQKITSKHSGRHPELIKITQLFIAMKEEMELHMQKEELILFPRIKEAEKYAAGHLPFNFTYLQAPVSVMEQEHDHAGETMAEIRRLTNDYVPPADACATYKLSYTSLEAFEKDLHQHVHLENNILFPKAMALFGGSKTTVFN